MLHKNQEFLFLAPYSAPYQQPYPVQPNIGFVNPGAGFGPGPSYPPQSNYPEQPPQGYDASGKPLNPPYMDAEDPNYKAAGFGFDDISIRAGFIRRVYGILSVS